MTATAIEVTLTASAFGPKIKMGCRLPCRQIHRHAAGLNLIVAGLGLMLMVSRQASLILGTELMLRNGLDHLSGTCESSICQTHTQANPCASIDQQFQTSGQTC